jgi:hypothetical protein
MAEPDRPPGQRSLFDFGVKRARAPAHAREQARLDHGREGLRAQDAADLPLTLGQVIEAECLTRHAARLRARAVALAEAHAVALAGEGVVAQQQEGEKEGVVADP